MRCDEIRDLIEPLADHELSAADEVTVVGHIRQCDNCQRRYDAVVELRTALRRHAQLTAPVNLRRTIQKQLRRESQSWKSRFDFSHPWTMLTASVLMGVVIGWMLTISALELSTDKRHLQAVIDAHVNALLVDHATDIASSDRHTVKPWFNGKLDFSPPVYDLANDGFPLLGGRLDYVRGRPAAALVYKRRSHIINVFIWPSEDDHPADSISQQGFNIVSWHQAGLQYYAVSDLNMRELTQFSGMYSAVAGS